MRTRLRLLPLLAAVSIGLAGCGGDGADTGVLEENLEAQKQAVDALRGRVDDLSDEVGGAPRVADPSDDIESLTTQLGEVTTRLEQVEVTASEAARDEGDTATVAAELGKFGEQIDELVATVRDLTTQLEQVRGDLDGLEEQVEEHRSEPFAHGSEPDPAE